LIKAKKEMETPKLHHFGDYGRQEEESYAKG
jgi:hypothetical protein